MGFFTKGNGNSATLAPPAPPEKLTPPALEMPAAAPAPAKAVLPAPARRILPMPGKPAVPGLGKPVLPASAKRLMPLGTKPPIGVPGKPAFTLSGKPGIAPPKATAPLNGAVTSASPKGTTPSTIATAAAPTDAPAIPETPASAELSMPAAEDPALAELGEATIPAAEAPVTPGPSRLFTSSSAAPTVATTQMPTTAPAEPSATPPHGKLITPSADVPAIAAQSTLITPSADLPATPAPSRLFTASSGAPAIPASAKPSDATPAIAGTPAASRLFTSSGGTPVIPAAVLPLDAPAAPASGRLITPSAPAPSAATASKLITPASAAPVAPAAENAAPAKRVSLMAGTPPPVPGAEPARVPASAPPAPAPGGSSYSAATSDAENPKPKAIQQERSPYFQQLKVRIHGQLVDRLDVQNLKTLPPDVVRREVRGIIKDLCQNEKGLLTSSDQERLMDEVMDETFGLGPLEILLKDPTISDILINRWDRIYVERKGRLELVDVQFRDNSHLRQIIERIVAQVGRRVDETSPMVDARLADGSRVNAIISPLALDGPAMSIRRFGSKPLMPEDLIRHGAFPAQVLDFLSAAVQSRCNVLISGGTGSGKTTLLNCLSRYIPVDERVITIEDAAELQLQQPHVVRLETRPPNVEGRGEVSQRDLVKNCLRMRPDRVIIGECRAGEALDMLQAMNTGHDGSMTTIHANSPRDAITRLEVLIAMAGYEIPTRGLRSQIAGALQIIIQASRLGGGKRKITRVSELTGMEGDHIQMQDIFAFEQTGVDEQGHAAGHFVVTGIRPKCLDRIESRGLRLAADLFMRKVIPVR